MSMDIAKELLGYAILAAMLLLCIISFPIFPRRER